MGKYSCVWHAYQNMDRCRNFGPLRTKKLKFLTHFDHINRLDYVEIPNLNDFFAKEDTPTVLTVHQWTYKAGKKVGAKLLSKEKVETCKGKQDNVDMYEKRRCFASLLLYIEKKKTKIWKVTYRKRKELELFAQASSLRFFFEVTNFNFILSPF